MNPIAAAVPRHDLPPQNSSDADSLIVSIIKTVFEKIIHLLKLLFSSDYRAHYWTETKEIVGITEDQAATKIQSVAKGFLVRARHQKVKKGENDLMQAQEKLTKIVDQQQLLNTYLNTMALYEKEKQKTHDGHKFIAFFDQQKKQEVDQATKNQQNYLRELEKQRPKIIHLLSNQSLNKINITEAINIRDQQLEAIQKCLQLCQEDYDTALKELTGKQENVPDEISPKQEMLTAIDAFTCPELAKVFSLLLDRFPVNSLAAWNCDSEGKFVLYLRKQVQIWVPSSQDPNVLGGVIMEFGNDNLQVTGRFQQDRVTIQFDSGFKSKCKYKIGFFTPQVNPAMKKVVFKQPDKVTLWAGVAPFGESSCDNPMEILCQEWGPDAELVTGDPWQHIESKLSS